MAAFLQLDISSEYPAMCKFILSAEGKNYEVRFILIVIQSVGVTCIALVLQFQDSSFMIRI